MALGPLLRLFWLGMHDGLGANPIEFVTRSTGTWALVGLCMTLAITPLRRLTGANWLQRLRRMLGLYAFFYALLHFTIWLVLDQGGDVAAMGRDIVKRPFITMGFTAFLLLLPLAATSTQWAMRRLGGKRWQALHRLVYLVAVLVILHYWWHKAGKHDFASVRIYAFVVVGLLAYRLWWHWRQRHQAR